MALIPTHIRFALDIKQRFPIQRLDRYIAGTVYPDSRWMTGVEREATHDSRFAEDGFPATDFEYGWHAHCVCDILQNAIHHDLYPHATSLSRMERWILFSVAKVIQDMTDLTAFDLEGTFKTLTYIETPNGEAREKIRDFYAVLRQTYDGGQPPTPSRYGGLWRGVGLDEDDINALVAAITDTLNSPTEVRRINGVYQRVMRDYNRLTSPHS